MPVGELFAQGPIEVMVTTVNSAQVTLGIRADPRFLIRQLLSVAVLGNCSLRCPTSSRPCESQTRLLPPHILVGRLHEELCVREPETMYRGKRAAAT